MNAKPMTHDFHMPLTSGEAILRVPRPMTQEDYDKLIEAIGIYLKLFRVQLIEHEEKTPSPPPPEGAT